MPIYIYKNLWNLAKDIYIERYIYICTQRKREREIFMVLNILLMQKQNKKIKHSFQKIRKGKTK